MKDSGKTEKKEWPFPDSPGGRTEKKGCAGKWFVIYFLSTFALIALAGIIVYRSQRAILEEKIRITEELHHQFVPDLIKSSFTDTAEQTLILGRLVSSQLSKSVCAPEGREELEKYFKSIAEISGEYCQIRFLDSSGKETVRVNHNGKSVRIVPDGELQDKADRYYYHDALGLEEDQLFVSQLDLNIEAGEVEVPFKPMIRFSSPVFSSGGILMGVVVVNSLADDLFDYIKFELGQHEGQNVYLVNPRGYYLFNSRDHGREFGFMFKGGENRTLEEDEKELWNLIGRRDSGYVFINHDLYIFNTVRPLKPNWVSSRNEGFGSESGLIPWDDYKWYLISHIPGSVISSRLNESLASLYFVFAGLILIFLLLSFFLGKYKSSLEMKKKTIRKMAYHDELTGLKSRVFGLKKLELNVEVGNSRGKQFAVFYCDVNKFKPINDRYGHEAGDRVLKEIARRLEHAVRPDDTVIRMGGDEFVLILENLPDDEETGAVCRRILEIVSQPIPHGEREYRLGISIGIALFPSDGRTVSELLQRSDEAMYEAKKGNRGMVFYRDMKN